MGWVLKNKIALTGAFLGAIVGFLYWNYVGCESGTCAITSVWYRTTIYGTIMGWLLGGLVNDKFGKRNVP